MKLAPMSAAAVIGLSACSVYPPPTEPAVGTYLPPTAVSGAFLSGADCFRSSDIRNHTIGDSRTLYLRVNRGDVYQVGMRGSCLAGAISSDPLVMRSPPGSSIVCRPLDLDVGVSKGGFSTPCLVDTIIKLSPEQVAAMPRKLKP